MEWAGASTIPYLSVVLIIYWVVPGGSVVKNPPVNAGNPASIPGSGRSPGEGNGNLLQYSCLEIPWTEEPGGLQSMELQKSWIPLS